MRFLREWISTLSRVGAIYNEGKEKNLEDSPRLWLPTTIRKNFQENRCKIDEFEGDLILISWHLGAASSTIDATKSRQSGRGLREAGSCSGDVDLGREIRAEDWFVRGVMELTKQRWNPSRDCLLAAFLGLACQFNTGFSHYPSIIHIHTYMGRGPYVLGALGGRPGWPGPGTALHRRLRSVEVCGKEEISW
jgi:hypothetical protein